MRENYAAGEAGVRDPGAHDHGAHVHGSATRVGWASAVNVSFAIVQVIAGLAIGSVVVLADAAHQVVDALGLVTALIALRFARRPADEQWTYGIGKSDALGGLLSALLLVGSVVWIITESIGRLVEPEAVSGRGVIMIGAIAIVVNGASVLLVGHSHGPEDISLRAARLHLLTDLAGSVVVVVAGVLLAAGGPAWIDPIASLLLSVAVLWTTWRLIVSATRVLLDRVPGHVSVADIHRVLTTQADVDDVHHVHLRPVSAGNVSVTAHVVVDGALSVHAAHEMTNRLSALLVEEHGVGHATLQLECHHCDDHDHVD
jgi:cobalt-zinc-cadmium efflux system protein